jgi:hypothetical protein
MVLDMTAIGRDDGDPAVDQGGNANPSVGVERQ